MERRKELFWCSTPAVPGGRQSTSGVIGTSATGTREEDG